MRVGSIAILLFASIALPYRAIAEKGQCDPGDCGPGRKCCYSQEDDEKWCCEPHQQCIENNWGCTGSTLTEPRKPALQSTDRTTVIQTIESQSAQDAAGPTVVTYINRTGKTLYVYSRETKSGGTIDCSDLNGEGSMGNGARKRYSVDKGMTRWVRFQEAADPCPSNINKFDSWIQGGTGKSEVIEIW